MNKKIFALSLSCAVGLLLPGCGTAPTNSPAPEGSANTQQSESSAGDSSETSRTKPFGSTFTWGDGVAVTVGKPKPFDPSSSAAITKRAKQYIVTDVVLKNGSKEAIEPMLLTMRATSGEEEAEAVFDTAKSIDMPTAPIQPGKQLKWKAAFSKPGKDFTMTVDWKFGNGSGTYAG